MTTFTATTSLYVVAVAYVLMGLGFGFVNAPITNTAVSGMPGSMAGVAASLASAGRQTGTTLGVALSGVGHGVWWLVAALGAGLVVLALVSTGRRAAATADRAAGLFDELSLPRPTG
jgi:hypothetical protein